MTSADQFEGDGRWTYLLVTPDGILTNRLAPIIDRVKRGGLAPRAGRILHLDAARMQRIYQGSDAARARRLPPPQLFQEWYSLGPAVLLLLEGAEGGDAARTLLSMKGPTDPAIAPADTLRHAGENSLMNGVHCPDDGPAASWELDQLLGEENSLMLGRAAASEHDAIPDITVDLLDDALPTWSGAAALSVPHIVNKLRLRLVQRAAPLFHADAEALAELLDVCRALERERRDLAGAGTSAQRWDVASIHNAELDQRLREVTQRPRARAWGEFARRLTSIVAGPPLDGAELTAAREGELVIVRHERVALAIHAGTGRPQSADHSSTARSADDAWSGGSPG